MTRNSSRKVPHNQFRLRYNGVKDKVEFKRDNYGGMDKQIMGGDLFSTRGLCDVHARQDSSMVHRSSKGWR